MYDTPGYGVIGALAATALLCWRRATTAGSRAWLPALAVVLTCAVALHPIGIVVAVAIAADLVVRAVRRREIDAATAVAVVVPFTLSSIVIAPQTFAAVGAVARHLTMPIQIAKQSAYTTANVQTTYVTLLGFAGAALLPLLATTIALDRSSRQISDNDTALRLPAAVLALSPLWAIAPAWLATGWRPDPGALLPVVVGCAVLAGWFGARIASSRAQLRLVWTVVLLGSAALAVARADALPTPRSEWIQSKGRFAVLDWHNGLAPDLPVVVPDPAIYEQLAYYAPRVLATRLFNVVSDAPQPVSMPRPATAKCPGRNVSDLASFAQQHADFYVFEASELRSPLLARLAAHGAHISLVHAWAVPTDLAATPAYLYRVRLSGR